MTQDNALKFNKFLITSNSQKEEDGKDKGKYKTVDLRGSGNPIIEYRESVFMPFVEITAYIIDTGNTLPADDGTGAGVGLLDGGFGQGTEKVEFGIEDIMGNKINFLGRDDLRVASVKGDFQGFKNDTFMLKIVSKEAFDNTLLKNRCGTEEDSSKFSGKISAIARTVVRKNLKSSKAFSMNTDETLNEWHGFGEDKTPFEMLLMLQKLAIPNLQTSKGKTSKGNTAGYLFFQTANGYQFKSLDKLFETKENNTKDGNGRKIRRYIENSRTDEGLPPSFDGKILWSNMSRSVDALSQFESGAWSSKVIVFNDVTKEIKERTLQSDKTGNGITGGSHLPILNKDYLDSDNKPLPTTQYVIRQAAGQTIKGLDTLEQQVEKSGELNYDNEDIYLQAHQNYRQKMSISAEICIAADLSLNAGDLIFLCFPELSTKATPVCSPEKSGIYMIADLCHYGTVANSFTGLHLVRDSFGVKT